MLNPKIDTTTLFLSAAHTENMSRHKFDEIIGRRLTAAIVNAAYEMGKSDGTLVLVDGPRDAEAEIDRLEDELSAEYNRGYETGVSEAKQPYQVFRYPLIERDLSRADLAAWYASRGIERPPRSVCIACFGNSADFYRKMAAERPDDFEKACALDEAIRHIGPQIMAPEGELYVSRSLRPLRELAETDGDPEAEDMGCQTGYCFY